MYNLESALEFANYQSTLAQQKTVIRQQFQDACIFASNGGLFLTSPEFIAGVQALGFDPRYIVDMNSNPIFISDVTKFYLDICNCYKNAVDTYGAEYSKLKQQRSVKSLVGL